MKEFVEKLISRLELKIIRPYFAYNAEYVMFKDVKRIVNQLAEEYINCSTDTSTNTSSGWIPCSEKPEENQTVMLTFKNSAGLHVGEATYKNNMFFYITDTEFGYYEEVYKNPIAWMPLPEPFTPKEGIE